MRKILILMGRYLPGYKDGGPLRSIKNLTDTLGDEYDFHIVCYDRDHGDEEPYPDILKDQWNTVDKAKVWYVSPDGYSKKLILKLSEGMDVIYVCGFMNGYSLKALSLNRAGRFMDKTFSVAPMGLLNEGAMAQKTFKKKVFISVFRALGFFGDIIWSVTNEEEAEDVRKYLDTNAECVIAEDLPRQNIVGKKITKKYGDPLEVVFISRISPKKNLMGAVKILQDFAEAKRKIEFTICGPCEDEVYWESCKEELDKLPKNVVWKYKGELPSESVQEEFADHDVFLFPSLGENYGHVIFEAMSAGCIPVISDRTPWRPDNYGYAIELENKQGFVDALNVLSEMSEEAIGQMSQNAINAAKTKAENAAKNTGYRKIFESMSL